MKLKTVQKIINEVYPKIEKHYGFSKFIPECTPYVETHYNIYARYSGEPEAEGEQDDCHAEFDRTDNSIVIYYPNMKSREHIIQTLVHEYQPLLGSKDIMIWDIDMIIILTKFKRMVKKRIGYYLIKNKC
jgi:hypothetical protein